MQKRVFLIHGWEGKPDNHWFPWLSWELKARGFLVDALTMPHADAPKVAEWIATIKEAVGRPTPATYFVGHSLGCIAIARYIAQLPPKAKVGGAVFVGGFSGRINEPEIAEFYSAPFDYGKTRTHGAKFTAIFSDNDKYVPFSTAVEFAGQIGAKTILERGKGHFCASDGVVALPSVFQSIIGMSSP